MAEGAKELKLTTRLIDALYTEAMLLADEARAYFDERGAQDRETLAPAMQVAFSCEALKATTRLMQVLAWLLNRRATEVGELTADAPSGTLGEAPESDADLVATLPPVAREMIEATIDLYERARRIDRGIGPQVPPDSPAHGLFHRLERSFRAGEPQQP
ncbi:hypothetical protein CLG96_15285 [Sphingomonas oleivorans]|uniref:Regulator of CtrA degradation rcdA n=1 Tax=Sphingomonas oleivorans TaxID=1735121 RepID=A0A2T5FUZ9_9SPHN|nr:DUF1465 family protein [Sphingomonas oleivorans]PTQ08556.1 hypothetical protein CLG96_15285 [Sphingomonas oleivorans]